MVGSEGGHSKACPVRLAEKPRSRQCEHTPTGQPRGGTWPVARRASAHVPRLLGVEAEPREGTVLGQWMNSSIINDRICSHIYKCHSKNLSYDIKYQI